MIFDFGKKVFTNPEGFDWYIDDTNEYCRNKLGKDYTVFVVAKDEEPIERILFEKNNPIYNTTNMENMLVKIDMIQLIISNDTDTTPNQKADRL